MDEIARKDVPAFPVTAGQQVYATGMSLRDWFAGQALAGLASNCTADGLSTWLPDSIARRAYDYADAMLAAREKGGARTSWIDGEPPRDGRFYLGMYADRSGHVVRRWDGSCWRDAEGEDFHEFAAGHGSIFWPEPIHDWPTRAKGDAS